LDANNDRWMERFGDYVCWPTCLGLSCFRPGVPGSHGWTDIRGRWRLSGFRAPISTNRREKSIDALPEIPSVIEKTEREALSQAHSLHPVDFARLAHKHLSDIQHSVRGTRHCAREAVEQWRHIITIFDAGESNRQSRESREQPIQQLHCHRGCLTHCELCQDRPNASWGLAESSGVSGRAHP
jgi:hypothetical protein